MLTLITIPTDFLAQIGTPATAVFSDIAPVVELIAGIALALFLAGWIVHLIATRGKMTDY